jgi:hypothetical protein
MSFVLSDEFDQLPPSEFFGTLKAMDKVVAPEHVMGISQTYEFCFHLLFQFNYNDYEF